MSLLQAESLKERRGHKRDKQKHKNYNWLQPHS